MPSHNSKTSKGTCTLTAAQFPGPSHSVAFRISAQRIVITTVLNHHPSIEAQREAKTRYDVGVLVVVLLLVARHAHSKVNTAHLTLELNQFNNRTGYI